jgi:signal transduction histidine kinase
MTRTDYATMSEEMSVTNEELLSLNEELHLKATALEQSKMELQIANEELLTSSQENLRILDQLRRTSANLQNLMVAANVPTLFLDSALKIRWFSPVLQDLFNVRPGDEGRPLAHVTHHLHYHQLAQDIAAVLATAQPRELEVSSSSDNWYLLHIRPYRTNDHQMDGVVLIFFDITVRRQAEIELRQLYADLEKRIEERTLELVRSNRELDQFAYIASHDLKAPLRAITNLAEWIQKDNAGLPPASQEHLTKLRARVRRMEGLLDDLLTYSRVGRQRHQPEWVDTSALVRGLQHILLVPAGFRIEWQEPLPTLHTERVPLETVLRNLVGNAIKHHNRPEAGVVQVAALENGEWVEFRVQDNGPGIAPQHHERIFQVFQSLKPRSEVEGSGMGLAIAKKAVESHGGWIQVESEAGQGATFRFTWPKATERNQPAERNQP